MSVFTFAEVPSSRCCTVRFTVLVAVAPPLALVAVTVMAEVPAGVPVAPPPPGAGLLLLPQPASISKAIAAKPCPARRRADSILQT
ncbi:MAG: hypothetical protein LAO78_23005 [Acidobacteriia bacterium]|nr:hypothetical protein [Terriglobia bacterium]